jgi:flagellar export protein FliJ
MKKFVFTLQKLYDVKASEEEQKRIQLKELDKELEFLIKKLNDFRDSFDKQKREYKRKCEEGINKDDLKNFGDYFNYLNAQIKQQNGLILDCENRISVCRQELWKLMMSRRFWTGCATSSYRSITARSKRLLTRKSKTSCKVGCRCG